MSRQDIFYSGSIANLREFKSQASMLSYRESSLNLQGTGASRVVLDALDGPEEDVGEDLMNNWTTVSLLLIITHFYVTLFNVINFRRCENAESQLPHVVLYNVYFCMIY